MAVAASLRPGDVRKHWGRRALAGVLAASAFLCLLPHKASAQFSERSAPFVGVPAPRNVPTASGSLGQNDPTAQMLVRADELQYDNANHRIIAVGNVQIYYK